MEESTFSVPLWSSIPFALMLLTIALGPLFFNHWWEKNRNKLLVSILLGLPVAIYLIYNNLSHNLIHQLVFDYIPFIVLIGSLFVITGGIHLQGDIKAKPLTNMLFLGIGAVLASIMGTTGAAMLLIRPVIRTNSQRKFKVHTILFFIATVANCGGLLTPLGDPPLFLMYLRGAEFTWFTHLLPEWALVNFLLLLVYFIVDTYYYKKENPEDLKMDNQEAKPIRIKGSLNFVWLIGIVLSVAFLNEQYLPFIKTNPYYAFIKDAAMILCVLGSLFFTKKEIREANKFSWSPITEVAFLFLGIFTTMVPALLYLTANAASFGLTEPYQFYYASGALSSFLDNAPTAVAFHGVAEGLVASGAAVSEVAGIPTNLLVAICLGSVFFGSMTYIGNGPNFMVKAIAEENNITMPSFFGYIFKFSLIVLLPIYVIAQLLLL